MSYYFRFLDFYVSEAERFAERNALGEFFRNAFWFFMIL